MRYVFAFLAIAALATPAAAQDSGEADEGLSLMERGAQLFMEGLREEMAPALEELGALGPQMRSFVEQMGPALGELFDQVKDWTAYHPPEILPNGDIIIRRKAPEEIGETPESGDPVDI